ncbi:MAG: fibronectin type III domain-containing protein [Patescibacteria group bacterium]
MHKLPLIRLHRLGFGGQVLRALALLALALWPAAAMAVPPSAVRNVEAVYADGAVTVTWQAPAEQGIVRYHIYYGHASILQSGGAYDDYAVTEDASTAFVLRDLPSTRRLYVAVLAVNEEGEEGTAFGDEATVEIPEAAVPESVPETREPAAASTAGMQLLAAQSASQTGVLLTFSRPATVAQQDAATAFRIVDGSGALLLISRIYVQGPAVLLVTAPQREGSRYSVSVAQVWGTGANGPVPVDPRTSVAAFSYPPVPGSVLPPAPQPSGALPVIRNVQLRIDGRQGDLYGVLAAFEIPAGAESVSAIEVFQSADGGRSFSAPREIPSQARSVRFENVPAGAFTVLLRAKTAQGDASPGITASITIGQTGRSRSPLTSTGAGLATVLALTGAVMGWRRMRHHS